MSLCNHLLLTPTWWLLPPDVQYNLDGESRLRGIMGCFSALGTVAFAYGGHNVVLEIQVIIKTILLLHVQQNLRRAS